MKDLFQAIVHDARAWCAGRSWPLRAPLLIWALWILSHHLRDPGYSSLFGGLNLGIHELGHVLLRPLGLTAHVLGGTLAQLLAPLASTLMFWRQRDYFAISFCFLWLGTNLFDVARYAGDARTLELPLLSLGMGEPIHDWHYLLSEAGLLRFDLVIERLLRLAGATSILLFLLAGGALLLRMRASPDRAPALPPWQ